MHLLHLAPQLLTLIKTFNRFVGDRFSSQSSATKWFTARVCDASTSSSFMPRPRLRRILSLPS